MFIRSFLFILAISASLFCKDVYVQCEDAKLYCKVCGSGEPLLVIHGGPGLSQDYLRPYLDNVAPGVQVIFYDQRGCGKSTGEVTLDTINMESAIKEIEAIREHFGFEKIGLLGHSWGGLVAMHYAIAHPESVDKMILMNPLPATSEEYLAFSENWKKRTEHCQTELETIRDSSLFQAGSPSETDRYFRTMFRCYCYDPVKANHLNLYIPAQPFLNGMRKYMLTREHLLLKPFDLIPSLEALDTPTLIINGDADIIPQESAEKIHEALENSEYYLIENCGHFPYVEQPEPCFEILKNFL